MNKQTKELNRLNNELDKQLNAENDKVLTDMICYLRVANISEYNQEVIRQDLLEMVLSAQKRGENIQTVIGEDYKVFCDNIIASFPPQSIKEKFSGVLNTVFLCTSVLGIINIITSRDTIFLIRNMITGEPLNFQISVSIGSVITYGMIIAAAFIIVHVICKTSFKHAKKENKIKLFIVGAGIMAIFLFLAWIGRDSLFTVNIFAACATVLVLYIAHKILARH
ncbi:MAG: hypothetical protein PHX85_05500 [Methanobacteriaceae archaeon]|jgi:DNA-binding ferritin-like protein (Dps family)|nr:hypothetical protein [Methanobacteriaceae archaeon]